MKRYQKGNEPTSDEMKSFAARFKDDQWNKLIKSPVFVEQYDKDLNLLAVGAELILSLKRPINTLKQLRSLLNS